MLPPITLRLVKGTKLNFLELDDNFTNLDTRTSALESVGIMPPLPNHDGLFVLRMTGGIATWEDLTVA